MTRMLNDKYVVSELQLKMIELYPGDNEETIAQVRSQSLSTDIHTAQTQLLEDIVGKLFQPGIIHPDSPEGIAIKKVIFPISITLRQGQQEITHE